MLCFSLPVKCLKNTPAFFAERLNKAMRVRNFPVEGRGVAGQPHLWLGPTLLVEGMGRATPQPRGRGPQAGGHQRPGKVGW